MPWSLYLALRQLFPGGRRPAFFSIVSILGVALGVAVLIITMAVMGGFGYEIRKMIVDTQGEVQVQAQSFVKDPDQIMAELEKVPGVKAVTPYAQGLVMLEHDGRPAFPAMQGLDLSRVTKVTPLQKFIIAGSLDDLDDDTVILSSILARNIGAHIGSKVEVYSPLLLEKLKRDEVLLPRELRVVGIFEIGHQQLDSSVVLVTLRLMQDLYGLDGSVHGFNVKIDDNVSAYTVASRINRMLPFDGRAVTWMEVNQDFLFVLNMEKRMIFFLLFFIILVAAFSMASSLLVTVVRKTREIGLLGALGATRWQMAACFCFQGMIIGICGVIGGTGLGWVALKYRNEIIDFFTRVTGSEQALLNAYQFNRLPAYLEAGDFWSIVAGTLIISTLAGLLPAWRASRLKPVEALRSE